MALLSYPFENANTTEDQYTLLFQNFVDSGVVASAVGSTDFTVSTDGSGLDVQITPGYAILRGHAVASDAIETVTLAAADATYARMDIIVLRLDPDLDGIVLAVKQGSASGAITAPTLVKTAADVYEMEIARVIVPANALNLTQSNITDRREFVSSDVGVWYTERRPTFNLRVGKLGYNLTTAAWEFWDGTAWKGLEAKRVIRLPHTFTLVGLLQMPAANGDYYVPPFFVSVPTGQKVTLRGIRSILQSGGSALFDVLVNGEKVYSATVTTTAQSISGLSVNVPDNATVGIALSGLSGAPKNMSCSLFLDYEA